MSRIRLTGALLAGMALLEGSLWPGVFVCDGGADGNRPDMAMMHETQGATTAHEAMMVDAPRANRQVASGALTDGCQPSNPCGAHCVGMVGCSTAVFVAAGQAAFVVTPAPGGFEPFDQDGLGRSTAPDHPPPRA